MLIELTQGYAAQVDESDLDLIAGYRWCVQRTRGNCYAVAAIRGEDGRRRLLGMHRLILNAQPGELVDHRNGDGLDNRRQNLRHATSQQNAANRRPAIKSGKSSRFKGVAWDKRRGRWIAQIRVDYKLYYLGAFSTDVAAARAYDLAAQEHFGEFASLNFPEAAHA